MGHVVFIHGLGQSASSWQDTIAYLSEYRNIYSPNLSAMLQHKEVTYQNLYDSFNTYCENFDEPLHLCGLSLGGVLALNYTIDYPEKVDSLVLIAVQYNMPKMLLKLQNMVFKCVPKSSFQNIGFEKKDFIQLTNTMTTLNFSGKLSDIMCDTMVVCGRKDHVNKKASKKLAEYISNSELQMVDNAGHEVNEQASRELAKILKAFYERK
ncbi:alpha/beta fold hydrolase [Virgibacillus chiguensis]|uniref:Lysophospholipase, alpha-beta hydrolase superfamily n=1 Tax=Virgibacillus chiguensis TaxID=411959 RepID=A0A1M5SA11_9BACI|nr:alpha/beta fold hydrolase [Virgibacillus chiguensis]SHH35319.1 Lysophospholipase, alpha-beta hydrolase superfamily [Virgibacillus chiguensis]